MRLRRIHSTDIIAPTFIAVVVRASPQWIERRDLDEHAIDVQVRIRMLRNTISPLRASMRECTLDACVCVPCAHITPLHLVSTALSLFARSPSGDWHAIRCSAAPEPTTALTAAALVFPCSEGRFEATSRIDCGGGTWSWAGMPGENSIVTVLPLRATRHALLPPPTPETLASVAHSVAYTVAALTVDAGASAPVALDGAAASDAPTPRPVYSVLLESTSPAEAAPRSGVPAMDGAAVAPVAYVASLLACVITSSMANTPCGRAAAESRGYIAAAGVAASNAPSQWWSRWSATPSPGAGAAVVAVQGGAPCLPPCAPVDAPLLDLLASLPVLRSASARAKIAARLLGADATTCARMLDDLAHTPLAAVADTSTPARRLAESGVTCGAAVAPGAAALRRAATITSAAALPHALVQERSFPDLEDGFAAPPVQQRLPPKPAQRSEPRGTQPPRATAAAADAEAHFSAPMAIAAASVSLAAHVSGLSTATSRRAAALSGVGAMPDAAVGVGVLSPHQRALLSLGQWASSTSVFAPGDALQNVALDLFLSAMQSVAPRFIHSTVIVHVLVVLCTSTPTSLTRAYYSSVLRTLFARGTSAARQRSKGAEHHNLAKSVVIALHDIIHAHVADAAAALSRSRSGELSVLPLPPSTPVGGVPMPAATEAAAVAAAAAIRSPGAAVQSTPRTPLPRHSGTIGRGATSSAAVQQARPAPSPGLPRSPSPLPARAAGPVAGGMRETAAGLLIDPDAPVLRRVEARVDEAPVAVRPPSPTVLPPVTAAPTTPVRATRGPTHHDTLLGTTAHDGAFDLCVLMGFVGDLLQVSNAADEPRRRGTSSRKPTAATALSQSAAATAASAAPVPASRTAAVDAAGAAPSSGASTQARDSSAAGDVSSEAHIDVAFDDAAAAVAATSSCGPLSCASCGGDCAIRTSTLNATTGDSRAPGGPSSADGSSSDDGRSGNGSSDGSLSGVGGGSEPAALVLSPAAKAGAGAAPSAADVDARTAQEEGMTSPRLVIRRANSLRRDIPAAAYAVGRSFSVVLNGAPVAAAAAAVATPVAPPDPRAANYSAPAQPSATADASGDDDDMEVVPKILRGPATAPFTPGVAVPRRVRLRASGGAVDDSTSSPRSSGGPRAEDSPPSSPSLGYSDDAPRALPASPLLRSASSGTAASASSTSTRGAVHLAALCPSSDRGGASLGLWMDAARAIAYAAVKLSSAPDGGGPGGDTVSPEYRAVLAVALQLCASCPLLREVVLRRILRKWPTGHSDNEIALLEFLATVLATTTHRADLVVTDLRTLLLRRIAGALRSHHIKVARNALVLVEPGRHLVDFLIETPGHRASLLGALAANVATHWSPLVRKASAAVVAQYDALDRAAAAASVPASTQAASVAPAASTLVSQQPQQQQQHDEHGPPTASQTASATSAESGPSDVLLLSPALPSDVPPPAVDGGIAHTVNAAPAAGAPVATSARASPHSLSTTRTDPSLVERVAPAVALPLHYPHLRLRSAAAGHAGSTVTHVAAALSGREERTMPGSPDSAGHTPAPRDGGRGGQRLPVVEPAAPGTAAGGVRFHSVSRGRSRIGSSDGDGGAPPVVQPSAAVGSSAAQHGTVDPVDSDPRAQGSATLLATPCEPTAGEMLPPIRSARTPSRSGSSRLSRTLSVSSGGSGRRLSASADLTAEPSASASSCDSFGGSDDDRDTHSTRNGHTATDGSSTDDSDGYASSRVATESTGARSSSGSAGSSLSRGDASGRHAVAR